MAYFDSVPPFPESFIFPGVVIFFSGFYYSDWSNAYYSLSIGLIILLSFLLMIY